MWAFNTLKKVFPSALPAASPVLGMGQAGAAGLCSLGPLAWVLTSSRRTARSPKPPLAGGGVQGDTEASPSNTHLWGCLGTGRAPILLPPLLNSSLEAGGEMTLRQGGRNDLTANYAEKSFSCGCT